MAVDYPPYLPPGECVTGFSPGPLLRSGDELWQPAVGVELARRIRGARVVLAHYELLRHDFPDLRPSAMARRYPGLAALSGPLRDAFEKRLIDRWLLTEAALVSESQASQDGAHTEIRTWPGHYPVFRPPLYGRAVVASLASNRIARRSATSGGPGLLDLKGAGVAPGRTPSLDGHATGLLALGQALAHLLREELFHRVFEHARAPFETLPTYAVLSCGFDVHLADDYHVPAAIQVRRAHRRSLGGGDVPHSGSVEQEVKLDVERLLRRYGIRSCTPGTSIHFRTRERAIEVRMGTGEWQRLDDASARGLPHLPGWRPDVARFDGVNVQTTREVGGDPRAVLVDFEHYTIAGRPPEPVLSLVDDRPLRWGGAVELGDEFDPDLLPPLADWGVVDEDVPGQPPGGPWSQTDLFGYELAEAWSAGRITGAEIRRELDRRLDAGTRHWPVRR